MTAKITRCDRCDMPAMIRLRLVNAHSGRVMANEVLCDGHRAIEESELRHHGLTMAQQWESIR
jgi:hypothetical protein